MIDQLGNDADDLMLKTAWKACWSRAITLYQMQDVVRSIYGMNEVYMERAVKSAIRRKILRRRPDSPKGVDQLYELNL